MEPTLKALADRENQETCNLKLRPRSYALDFKVDPPPASTNAKNFLTGSTWSAFVTCCSNEVPMQLTPSQSIRRVCTAALPRAVPHEMSPRTKIWDLSPNSHGHLACSNPPFGKYPNSQQQHQHQDGCNMNPPRWQVKHVIKTCSNNSV